MDRTLQSTIDQCWGPLPVGGRPIYSGSEVPISKMNNEGVMKQVRRIANSPPDLDAEGSDEIDSEEVDVVPISSGHPVNYSPSHPPAKRLQSHIIHNTPTSLQHILATVELLLVWNWIRQSLRGNQR
ncbi:hypothetical protein O181_035228 [Austropuccinia psidii MF-1]|uniref:Uncharacterized protein n=1 Tax=Austropuccinia psidii MF-1 TaxID=1389203 RepID=A0A9Q3D520_9BASI|nr:hypothetical protein [Austropuccinia psidii MF-1]